MKQSSLPIAVVDSGLGGLSVLRELLAVMPDERYLYLGDTANAPYGTKDASVVRDLTFANFETLRGLGMKAFVLACNTATGVAVKELRAAYPDLPIIGVEPALKPAALGGDHPTVAVLATPLTLKQQKFSDLLGRYSECATVIPFPCPGLVEYVERGVTEGEELDGFLNELLAPLRENRPDSVVLGCTHYPLVKGAIQKALGSQVTLYDGGRGTALQTKRRLEEAGLLSSASGGGEVHFLDSSFGMAIDHADSFLVRYGKDYLCKRISNNNP